MNISSYNVPKAIHGFHTLRELDNDRISAFLVRDKDIFVQHILFVAFILGGKYHQRH